MAKLIQLHEAATRLGITPEQLTEMRNRNEIFGYRDGSTWKFKESELERVATQLQNEKSSDMPPIDVSPADSVDADLDELVDVKEILKDDQQQPTSGDELSPTGSDDGMNLADNLDDNEADAILVSEAELGTPTSGGSTIIGHDETDSLLSDIQLGGSSDVADKSDAEIALSEGSELRLVPGSDVLGDEESSDSPSSGGKETADLTGLAPEDANATSLSSDAKDVLLDGGTDLKLESASGSEFTLAESSIDLDGSDIDVIGGTDAGNASDGDVDVLLGSSSDVTLSSDSGINLSSPSESGILLEGFDTDASGLSSDMDSLDLSDDEILSLGDDAADMDASTQLESGDDFLLEPDDVLGEEGESGSQVIALDSEELDSDEVEVLSEHVVESIEGKADGAASVAVAPTAAGQAMVTPEAQEYSIWNVLGLMACVGMLILGGTMITDIIRSMWSWNEPYSLNSSLMDFIISIFSG